MCSNICIYNMYICIYNPNPNLCIYNRHPAVPEMELVVLICYEMHKPTDGGSRALVRIP